MTTTTPDTCPGCGGEVECEREDPRDRLLTGGGYGPPRLWARCKDGECDYRAVVNETSEYDDWDE